MLRVVMLLLIAGELFFLPQVAQATTTNLTRQEIRSLPITERPSRPGHFYGNTVRRRQR